MGQGAVPGRTLLSAGRTVRLESSGLLEPEAIVAGLLAHDVPGAEVTDAEGLSHSRVVAGPLGPRLITLRFDPEGIDLVVGDHAGESGSAAVTDEEAAAFSDLVRAWFDLDADLEPVHRVLAADPLLTPLLSARPGLRVTGAPDAFQTAATTVLGQQVSLAAARTFSGRLTEAFGEDGPGAFRRFPNADAIASAEPTEVRAAVGLTGARAASLCALARAWQGRDAPLSRSELLALPGIGPWTADYLEVRFGDRDAFTPGDLVLRRALGGLPAKDAAERARLWSPFRAYALIHLWTDAAYSVRRASRQAGAAERS